MSQQYQQPAVTGEQRTTFDQKPGQHDAKMVGTNRQGAQFGRPPTSQTYGQQSGVQGTQTRAQGTRTGGSTGLQFEDTLSSELRMALDDFNNVAKVAEWCADRSITQGARLSNVVRICQDIADLAELNGRLIARDSIHGPIVAEAFLAVAKDGIAELRKHRQPFVTQTVSVIQRAIDSTEQLLHSVGRQPTRSAGTGSQQFGSRQSGPAGKPIQQPDY